MNRQRRVFNIEWGKLWGEAREKKTKSCGELAATKFSPIIASCPQSYPQGFPRVVQRLIPQSTGSTTITALINIY